MLRLENITLGYDRQVILRDISLSARRGEVVGIIGPNGSGKSTLLRGICRILQPKSGRVLIDDSDIAKMSRIEIARLLAIVPQAPSLPETFTAFEIVLMGRSPHLKRFRFESKKDFDIAWWAMGITGTQEIAERQIDQISGGQKQLLTIARAMAQEPQLILLDEPTAYLDINHQAETLDFIKKLCYEHNLAAVAVLHDLNLAAQYCDRLVLLSEGRVYAEGSPDEVITEGNIREVYGAEVCVYPHPINNLPTTLIIPADSRKQSPEVFDE